MTDNSKQIAALCRELKLQWWMLTDNYYHIYRILDGEDINSRNCEHVTVGSGEEVITELQAQLDGD